MNDPVRVNRGDNILSGPDGCSVSIMSLDGEVIGVLPVKGGVQSSRPYFDLLEVGMELWTDGVALAPPSRYGVVEPGDRFQSGANPDFVPTMKTDFERYAEAMIRQVVVKYEGAEARAQAFQRELAARSVPAAPAPAEPDLIEPAGDGQ